MFLVTIVDRITERMTQLIFDDINAANNYMRLKRSWRKTWMMNEINKNGVFILDANLEQEAKIPKGKDVGFSMSFWEKIRLFLKI